MNTMQWVKASERLPDRKSEYFLIVDDYKAVGIYDGKDFWSDDKKLFPKKWLDESGSGGGMAEALEDLLEAILKQKNDANWWLNELTIAVEKAKEALKQ